MATQERDTHDIDEAVLSALERDFQQVLVEMSGDQSIEKFRKEFQKLYDRLKKSHENEKYLLTKSKELGNSIARGTGMIKSAMTMATCDQTTKNMLRNELDEGKTLLNHYKEKIERGKARMDNYGAMIKNLEDQLKVSESFQTGRDNEKMSLRNAKVDLMTSRDELLNHCTEATNEIANMR
jgi:chromosome segregation ATPase